MSSTPLVKGILILDSRDGSRIHAKYFCDNYLQKSDNQLKLEKSLFKKTQGVNARSDADIVLLDNMVCVFRTGIDVVMFVLGAIDENEIILSTVLDTMFHTLNTILRNRIEKRVLLENLHLVLLTVDELLDGGMIMECDSSAIVTRIQLKNSSTESTPIHELSIGQALLSAREQLAKSFQAY